VILAGDVGGTNARFALFEPGGLVRVRQEELKSHDFKSLEHVIEKFLGPARPPIEAATFGIAGPVVGGRAKVTNLPWIVDAAAIASAFSIPRVTLVNDLVALAFGALTVDPSKLLVLSGGGPPKVDAGNVAVIAAGTGLGEAALVWNGARHVPCPTEGGHVDLAARNRLEFELVEHLQARFGSHVSYERVVAGPGFGNLYDFFVEAKKVKETPELAARIAKAPDRNKEIAALGEARASEPAARAFDLFASLYGAETGNLALKTFATGGVFVCGGIAAKYGRAFVERGFVESFLAKGRFTAFLENVPVAIVLDSDIGLAGSAYYAATAFDQSAAKAVDVPSGAGAV
jgi:glucokinase